MLGEYATNSQNDVAAGFNPESEVQKAAQERLRQKQQQDEGENRQMAGDALGIIGGVLGGILGGPAGAALGSLPGKALGGRAKIPGLDQLSAVLNVAQPAAPVPVPQVGSTINTDTSALDRMRFGAGFGQ